MNIDDERNEAQTHRDSESVQVEAPPPAPGLELLLERNLRGELHRLVEPGTIVDGKWELTRRIGAGGFGCVYEAWHLVLDCGFAIKFLGERHQGAAVREAFLREAQLMSRIAGEHLIGVSDFGCLSDGVPYFVMDLIQGPSLRQHLRQRPHLVDVVDIADGVLAGLCELHEQGYVHGDIKPENIGLSERGVRVRLLDFGMARTSMLARGGVGGTPPYMAPETLSGESTADSRADVYAAGVVMYEMLTGRLPRGHRGMTLERMRQPWRDGTSVLPVRVHRTETSEALDRLVMDALAADPNDRPASAREMLDRLRGLGIADQPSGDTSSEAPGRTAVDGSAVEDSVVDSVATPARTSAGGRRRRLIPAVAAVAVVGMAVGWGMRSQPALDLDGAAGGVVVVTPGTASVPTRAAFDTLCQGLGGDRPAVSGLRPTLCLRVPATQWEPMTIEAEARRAGALAVIAVGESGVTVRTFDRERAAPVLARLDGLELPSSVAVAGKVVPVLTMLVDRTEHDPATVPVLEADEVGMLWAIVAETLRWESTDPRGTTSRRQSLAAQCHRVEADPNYCALATLSHVRSPGVSCSVAEPALASIEAQAGIDPAIGIAASLERAACLAEDPDATRLSQAEALLSDAIGRSGDQPCTRLAAVGTVSIVAARGGDRDGALRRRTVEALPTPSTCERWLRARVMAVRGDALVFGHRWCDAARAYADAYQAARSGWKPLVNWAEYTALCTWDAGTPRGRGEYDSALLEALVIDPSHTPREALSLAYLRWRLTDTVDDALRLLALFEAVPVSDVALAPDVASDLGPAVCAQQPACVYQWLTQPKRPGTTTVLRRALGLP